MSYIPWDVVRINILPKCDIDTRVAMRVPPGRVVVPPRIAKRLAKCVKKKKMVQREPGFWSVYVDVPGTDKTLMGQYMSKGTPYLEAGNLYWAMYRNDDLRDVDPLDSSTHEFVFLMP